MSAFLRCFSRPSIPSSKPNGAWFSLLRGAAKSCLPVDGKAKQEKIVDGHISFPNDTNCPTRNLPKRNQPFHVQLSQAKCVGAAPVCPPERPRIGVSMPKIHALCAGNERWMRPCGATRAGTQAPPLPISTKPRGMPLPHHIVHSIAHANHAVCHYPIGVILSIAQGWQVQRSLPWVMMQARRLPPWGLYFSHHTSLPHATNRWFPTRKLILKSTMPMA